MRKELEADPFMKECVCTGDTKDVTWEHCWTYAGKQINEKWAIVPLTRELNVNPTREAKEYCRWVSINRATEKDFEKYPRKDWKGIKKYLNDNYGN